MMLRILRQETKGQVEMLSHQGLHSGIITPTLSARVCGLSSLGGEDQSLRGSNCVGKQTTPASTPAPQGPGLFAFGAVA